MKPRMSQRIQFSLAYLLVAVIVLSFLQSWLLAPRTIEIPMSKFLELLEADQIQKVAVTEREIRGMAKPGALPAPPTAAGDRLRKILGTEEETRVFVTTRIPLIDDQQLVDELRAHNVEFAGRIETTFFRDLLFQWIIPLGVMVAIWMFLMRRVGGGPTQALSFGRSKHKIFDRKELKTTFADVAGASGFVGGHDEREQTLNQLLAEMDGFDSSKGVIIMAATNRPEVLDQALLRPGRFDRQVVVDKPDIRGREAILRLHARAVVLAPNVELAVIAARKEKHGVEMADLEEDIDRGVAGLETRRRVL